MKRRSPKKPDIDESPLLVCPNLKLFYEFQVEKDEIVMFRLPAELTQKLGLNGPKLIAAKRTRCPERGMMLLYSENNHHDIGRFMYDRFTGVSAIVKGNYDFVFPSDVEIVGEPVGYCDAGDINNDFLRFRKIPFVR